MLSSVFRKQLDEGYFLVVHSYYVGNWEEGDGRREHKVVLKTRNEEEAVNRYIGMSEWLGDMSLTEEDITLLWPSSHRCRHDDTTPWGEAYCRCGRRYSAASEDSDPIPF